MSSADARTAVRLKTVPCQTRCTHTRMHMHTLGGPRVGPRPLGRPARSRPVGVPMQQDPVAPTLRSAPRDRSEGGARLVCLQRGSVSRSPTASPDRAPSSACPRADSGPQRSRPCHHGIPALAHLHTLATAPETRHCPLAAPSEPSRVQRRGRGRRSRPRWTHKCLLRLRRRRWGLFPEGD